MIGLAGCASGEEPEAEQPAPPQSSTAPQPEPTESDETDAGDAEGEAVSETPIRIGIDGDLSVLQGWSEARPITIEIAD